MARKISFTNNYFQQIKINRNAFKANAFDLFDKAMDFLAFSLPVAAHIESGNPDRIETPAIPYSVLREAITNALVHRDYSHTGGSIAIAIYDDRVNITNAGFLPSGIRISQLAKDHPSMPRNPVIAHVFYLCRKIEKWGRGTIDMVEDCKRAGNPSPNFEEIGNHFSVTLPFKKPIRSLVHTNLEHIDLSRLTPRQQAIINALKNGPLKTQEIIKVLHLNLTDRSMRLELAQLKKMGLIKSKGKTKSSIWLLNNHE